MRRQILFISLGVLAWVGFFFWWMSSWPASVNTIDTGKDLLWRSIQKKEIGWERVPLSEEKKGEFVSYQEWKIILYWQGNTPQIQKDGEEYSVSITSGKWIIRSLSQTQKISIKLPNSDILVSGVWGVFISVEESIVANFDANMTLDGTKMLPSFLSREGKIEFFDLLENKEIISADLWLIYVSFFPRDQEKALGNITKKFLDSMMKTFLAREPESKDSGLFRHDVRVRNALEEVQSLINKIEVEDSCWGDSSSCFTILEDVFRRERSDFPEVFLPLERATQAWLQIDKNNDKNDYSWTSVFRTYHMQLISNDPRARVIRDKAILEMIQSWTTVSSIEIWDYLTRMLASQKLWSAYSLQIVREMIRIGDILQRSPESTAEVRKSLTKSAIESLSNLKGILENTYFTQKEYWFVLRDDLLDSEGKSIQNQVFINDLQALIKQIDTSSLIQDAGIESEENLRVIRAQLAWFNCIFSRNEEYVGNPRICRATTR